MSTTPRLRCRRCKRLRRRESFFPSERGLRRRGKCRACRLEHIYRRRGARKLLNVVRAFGIYEDELRTALGPTWPDKLLRAKEEGR